MTIKNLKNYVGFKSQAVLAHNANCKTIVFYMYEIVVVL